MNPQLNRLLPAVAVAIMLLWALYPGNPYSYYKVLRIAVFALFAYYSFRAFRADADSLKPWLAAGIALLYNPFEYVALGRPLWSIVNLLTIAAIFLLSNPGTPRQK